MKADLKLVKDYIIKHPFSASKAAQNSTEEELAALILELPTNLSLLLFNAIERDKIARCFKLLPNEITLKLIDECDPHLTVSIVKQLDSSHLNELMKGLKPERAEFLKQKLSHAEDMIGAYISTAHVIYEETLVKDAIQFVKEVDRSKDSYFYSIDTEGRFCGLIKLHELLLADENILIRSLLITTVPKFLSETPLKSIENHIAWQDFREIPVIDSDEKLLGVLSYKSIINESKNLEDDQDNGIIEISKSLAELYYIGLTSFVRSVGKR